MNNEDKMKAELRRSRLMRIINDHFARDNLSVVNAIREQTRQEVSVRSIQTWLIHPSRKSHRALPEWALQALEQYVARDDKKEHLAAVRHRVESRRAQPHRFAHADDVHNWRAVEMATNEVEWEACEQARWSELFGSVSGAAIAKQFRAMERQINSMSTTLAEIAQALLHCENFEDFRRHTNDSMRNQHLIKISVGETRGLYESKSGEFQREDGLPPPSP